MVRRQESRPKKTGKRNETDELYEELSLAADALIEMQQAVDEGLDCIERLAGRWRVISKLERTQGVDTLTLDQIEVK